MTTIKYNDKKYCDLMFSHFAIPYYLEKYNDMITIEYNKDYYELVFTLTNSTFNKELLRKLFGATMVTGGQVKAIFRHKDYVVVSDKIKKFLDLNNLLNG